MDHVENSTTLKDVEKGIPKKDPNDPSSGYSMQAKIGIGMVIGIAVTMMIVGIAVFAKKPKSKASALTADQLSPESLRLMFSLPVDEFNLTSDPRLYLHQWNWAVVKGIKLENFVDENEDIAYLKNIGKFKNRHGRIYHPAPGTQYHMRRYEYPEVYGEGKTPEEIKGNDPVIRNTLASFDGPSQPPSYSGVELNPEADGLEQRL